MSRAGPNRSSSSSSSTALVNAGQGTMIPLVLHGHKRPITAVEYNRDGDLLFSASKDSLVTLWKADNGERLGVFKGHEGVVYSMDVSRDSTRLLTGSSDDQMMMWDVYTGKHILLFEHLSGVRVVRYAIGEKRFFSCTDATFGQKTSVNIFTLPEEIMSPNFDFSESFEKPVMTHQIFGWEKKVTTCEWGPLNETIVSGSDDGTVRQHDAVTGELISKTEAHKGPINRVRLSNGRNCLFTASSDQTAKMWDLRSMELIKEYKSDTIVNDVDVSPLFDHVLLGGGQQADAVTTTAAAEGNFEARLFHRVYGMEMGRIEGHFGPINCLSFSPDGHGFVTGGEEGVVRLHRFPQGYFSMDAES